MACSITIPASTTPNEAGRSRRFVADESGSAAVESAIVFPAVFMAVLALVFGAMIFHERVLLFCSASAAAERAAFRWDNSHRDPVTGVAPAGRYDPLYWRLTDDGLLQSIFGLDGGAEEGAAIELPPGGAAGGRQDSLIAVKLLNGAGRVPDKYDGQAAYRRQLPLKLVAVELETFDIPPGAARLTGISGIRAAASAPVSDPVELIRTIDLARHYAERFGAGAGGAEQRKKAGGILMKQSNAGDRSG